MVPSPRARRTRPVVERARRAVEARRARVVQAVKVHDPPRVAHVVRSFGYADESVGHAVRRPRPFVRPSRGLPPCPRSHVRQEVGSHRLRRGPRRGSDVLPRVCVRRVEQRRYDRCFRQEGRPSLRRRERRQAPVVRLAAALNLAHFLSGLPRSTVQLELRTAF